MQKNEFVKVKCKIKNKQLSEISKEWLDKFFIFENHYDSIIMVYDGDVLKTLISYEDYIWIDEHKGLEWYFKYSNNNKIYSKELTDSEIISYSGLGRMFPLRYLLIELCESETALFWKCENIGFWTKEYLYIKEKLKSGGVEAYTVNFPTESQIISDKRHDNMPNLYELNPWLVRNLIRKEAIYTEKVTDNPIEFLHGRIRKERDKGFGKNNNKKTIYIVGPCIVSLSNNIEGEDFPSIFYELVKDEYNVIVVSAPSTLRTLKIALLEYNIKKNDIVFLLHKCLVDADFDLRYLYNTYCGDKWLYHDVPIHTSVTRNRMVAKLLYDKEVIPRRLSLNEEEDEIIIHYGEPQFTNEYEVEVKKYISKIKKQDIPMEKS